MAELRPVAEARETAALFDSDRDDERQDRARMLAELFDLRKERAC
jgi:hypothetical protein